MGEASTPWLVVGLGNPGPEYASNRHNVGFMVVERWVDLHAPAGAGPLGWKNQWKGRTCSLAIEVERQRNRCVVLEPLTFMNRSGESVRAAIDFLRIGVDRLIVVHDELDFEFGRLGVKRGGGHGGHNGLRDLIKQLGSPEFARVRVGIGRPVHGDVSHWVLSDFAGDESSRPPAAENAACVSDLVDRAAQALTCLLVEGLASAMNQFNRSPTAEAPN
jgi:PTH1 family peptidyl-tRNA hydrolase